MKEKTEQRLATGWPLCCLIAVAPSLARKENPESSVMAWYDGTTRKHSPSQVECDGKTITGWEEYGQNHGGKLRLSFNHGGYVFICT